MAPDFTLAEFRAWALTKGGKVSYPIPAELDRAVEALPNTFGALAARLESLCPQSEWTRPDAYMAERVEA